MESTVAERLRDLARKCDERLSVRAGYNTHDTFNALDSLLVHGSVEVGYRQACGTTDPTQHTYREWVKVLKAAAKAGLVVAVAPVKHGNAWATKCGGFWSSSVYTISGGMK